ncbi:MAG: MATE family efflux transporter [Pseudomonadales bacterium]
MTTSTDPLTAPITSIFLRYTIPGTLGLLAVSSAGVIDGAFVGNYVGSDALAAVNFSMPVISLVIGIAYMLAIGGSVIAGKQLGEGDAKGANQTFNALLFGSLFAGVTVSGLGLLALNPLVFSLGVSGDTTELVSIYLELFLYFVPVIIVAVVLGYFVRIDDQPLLASGALIIGAVANVIFDWIFIVELEFGLAGAAWGTGLAELVTLLVVCVHFFRKECKLTIAWVGANWSVLPRACINGSSDFINDLSAGITVLIFNWAIMTRLGVDGVAAFAIINYILYMGIMVCYGISDSVQPLISKNFGAGHFGRMRALMRTSMGTVFGMGLAIIALLWFAPTQIIKIFLDTDNAGTAALAMDFIVFVWPAFLFIGVNLSWSAYLTAIHKPIPSAIIATLRSLAFPALLLLTLPRLFGDPGIYMAIPVSEFLCFIVAFYFWMKYRPSQLVP